MFDFLKPKKRLPLPWPVDMHSHLIPGIDDGARTPEDALAILRVMRDTGITRWWTTPHIFQDYYRNTPESIRTGLKTLRDHMHACGEYFEVDAAAEYYLDDHLMAALDRGDELLALAGKYLLVETNTLTLPLQFEHFVFQVGMRGLQTVLAHPERYEYLVGDFNRMEKWRDKGVLFQVNMLSFSGAYGPGAKRMARDMAARGLIDFLGSDCHHRGQAERLAELQNDKWFRMALEGKLMNHYLS